MITYTYEDVLVLENRAARSRELSRVASLESAVKASRKREAAIHGVAKLDRCAASPQAVKQAAESSLPLNSECAR